MKWYLIFAMIVTFSCQKDSGSGCDDGSKTLRIVSNAPATISFFENQYFITEQNTIDTRLIPCTLPVQFQRDRLPVTVSGEVKKFPIEGKIQICCTERILLTKIEER